MMKGKRLGPYEIVDTIGAGGMGEVWLAKDTRLDREVAIKILPAGLAQNEKLLQRFEREAKAISSLNHPNICTLYDVGEMRDEGGLEARSTAGETPALRYLVMEYIEGESLADRLKKGPLPLHEVLRYGQQIASALALLLHDRHGREDPNTRRAAELACASGEVAGNRSFLSPSRARKTQGIGVGPRRSRSERSSPSVRYPISTDAN